MTRCATTPLLMTRSAAVIALCGLSLAACSSTAEAPTRPSASAVESASAMPTADAAPRTFGPFTAGEALSADEAVAQAASLEGQVVRVGGTIREVCQGTGCWLAFSTNRGQTLRMITHEPGGKDTPFLLFPKDASGRHAEVIGTLRIAEGSAEDRRRLAEAAGVPADDVASITDPEGSVSLMISAVQID